MKIISHIVMGDLSEEEPDYLDLFVKEWNEFNNYPEEEEYSEASFYLEYEGDEYRRLMDFIRQSIKKYPLIYTEHLDIKYTKKELLSKQILTIGFSYDIDLTRSDIEKTYRVKQCPVCHIYLEIEQKNNIYISNESIYTADIYEPHFTRKIDICTVFPYEIIVSKKVRDILLDSKLSGFRFEDVYFENKKYTGYYQMLVTGKPVQLSFSTKHIVNRCEHCGNYRDDDVLFVPGIPAEPKICIDSYDNSDITYGKLLSVTTKGYNLKRYFFSQKCWEILRNNKIRGYGMSAAYLVDCK